MVSDRAAGRGAEHTVPPGEVAGNAAHDCAFRTIPGFRRASGNSEREQQHYRKHPGFHDATPEVNVETIAH
jgi:hypothetical protein